MLRLKYLSNYTETEVFEMFTLTNLTPIFITLLSGYTLSLIVLVIETIVSGKKKALKKERITQRVSRSTRKKESVN